MWDKPHKKLPVHFPPEQDELLSSWLVRLATAHHIKLYTFSKHIFGRRRIWNKDIDTSADSAHIAKIIEYTGRNYDEIYSSTLWGYEGILYEKHNPSGIQKWILPVGIYRQTRKRFGLQMCPLCLAEDSEPYYRKLWRISWATVCTKHNIRLLDRCAGCGTPVIFHRGEMGWKNQPVSFSNVVCSVCDLSWISPPVIESLQPAHADVFRFQQKLEKSLHDNWVEIKGFGYVHSINFFNGLKHILRVLSVSRRTAEFREAVGVDSGLPLGELYNEDKRAFSFEYLSAGSRYDTLRLASWMIADWSNIFISVARKNNTFISAFLPYNESLPYWYWLPLNIHLSRQKYLVSEKEISAGVSYLEKNKSMIMIGDLTDMLGTEMFSGKPEGFLISVYERIKKHNKQSEKERLATVRTEAKKIRLNQSEHSKTMALKLSRDYLRNASKAPKQFNKVQALLDNQIRKNKRRERLKMAKQMEKEQNAVQVSRKFGVSPQIITKWYRRYQEGGIKNLDDRPRSPQNFPHKKVYSRQEKWIWQLHSEGLELKAMRDELEKRFDFEMTEGGLYAVLQRLELPLPCSSKNKFFYRNRRKAAKRQSFPQRKIFEKERNWILELHAEGLSTPKIKKELKKRYNFEISLWAVRNAIIKNQ